MPLLHIHGEKDTTIDSKHHEGYINGRQNASALTKTITLPNADHDFSDPEDQQRAIEETTQWFKETL